MSEKTKVETVNGKPLRVINTDGEIEEWPEVEFIIPDPVTMDDIY